MLSLFTLFSPVAGVFPKERLRDCYPLYEWVASNMLLFEHTGVGRIFFQQGQQRWNFILPTRNSIKAFYYYKSTKKLSDLKI